MGGLRGSIRPEAHHVERSFDARLPELTVPQAKSIAWRFFDEAGRKLDLADADWSLGDDNEAADINEELARLAQAVRLAFHRAASVALATTRQRPSSL